ncbi:potassium channel family protein [Glycomyces sp. NPDC049804]|uniref:potassium channel family protein n=1 Tax=Glycomyces sp. NPDC049804 TaxID=3154363 RepID=UPI003426689B
MQDETKPRRGHPLRWLLACVALMILYSVVPVSNEPESGSLVLRWTATVLILAGLAFAIRWQSLRQLREPDAPLGALIVAILAGLLLFALLDYALAVNRPGEFNELHTRVDALYYAVSTLATVGFGDVSAQGQVARTVLCVQMAFNLTAIASAASIVARKFGERAAQRAARGRGDR